MQFYTGSPALSSFRLEKLLSEIQQNVDAVSCISSHFIHFADLSEELTQSEAQILEKLLEYGPAISDNQCDGKLFLVTPRVGTISPWSSKSTDIAHNCGLDKVLRLERGIAYIVGTTDGQPLNDIESNAIGHILHNRI